MDEHEAAMLLEARKATKTASEIRSMISQMDADKNHRISFIEWCCAFFEKSYDDLNDFADEESRERALAAAREAAERARKVEEEIQQAKEREEEIARLRAEEIERESKLTGVAGMSAFFKRQAENAKDSTMTNEQKIKEEAARRKELREAKKAISEAEAAAASQKSAEDVAREVHEASLKQQAEAEALAKKKEEDEKAARAARKAEMNAKWQSPK